MNLDVYVAQMAANAHTIRQIIAGVSAEQARWKPDAESWSILEVINHLDDEERLDFRVRLDYILHKPGEDPPQIDPAGWVTARRYNERDLQESVDNFTQAREESLMWLKSLGTPDWDATYVASWGSISAGDMFAAWVAHDLLHLRQLVELHYAWTTRQVAPYSVKYAGEW